MKTIKFFDGYTSATAPTVSNISASSLGQFADDAAFVTNKGSVAADGDCYYNTTSDVIKYYKDGVWTELLDEDLAHLTDTENPHSVTYSQVGAAAASHSHVEADITDLSHDATHIAGVEVDDTDIGNLKALVYNDSTKKLEYETLGAASLPITTQGDLIIGDTGGAGVRIAIGAANTILTSNGTTASWATPATQYSQIVILKDVKSANTAGGTFTQDAWRTRTLNTVENAQSWCSLSSNQFTLDAGTYKINISCPAFQVVRHKCKLYNISDSTNNIIGSTAYTSNGDAVQTNALACGIIIITSQKTFEVQHYCQTTVSTTGFGVAANFGVSEVYSIVEIEKIGG